MLHQQFFPYIHGLLLIIIIIFTASRGEQRLAKLLSKVQDEDEEKFELGWFVRLQNYFV